MVESTNSIHPPNLGDKLGADEKYQKIRGKESYFVMAMDLATRFILAWEASTDYDATQLYKKAKARAGKTYRIFITDGLHGYSTTRKRVFGTFRVLIAHM